MSEFYKKSLVYFDDLTDVYAPELWAAESIDILEANTVMANLVHRDFEALIQSYGDVVNTRQPATFTAVRKDDDTSVTKQTASATNVPVPLNQHLHTSFIIKDGQASKGFKNLVAEFLRPAVVSIAQELDRILLCQCYQFIGNSVGKLGVSMSKQLTTDAAEKLNTNKAPLSDRYFIVTPSAQNYLQNVSDFTTADAVADSGLAMREGIIGRRMGFTFFMCQNAPQISATNLSTKTAAINLTAGYAAGSTSIVVSDESGTIYAGEWLTVAGDMTPQFITNVTSHTLTISPGLAYAVENDAVVTVTTGGAINYSAGYDTGYVKALTVDGFASSKPAKPNQLISTGTTTATRKIYGAIGTPTITSLWLDRPLESDLAHDAILGVGPAGNYCFAFNKNAIALVTRPLATPQGNVRSFVANYKGLSIRVCITYDGDAQGDLVTVDLLCGVKVLDTNLGCLVYC